MSKIMKGFAIAAAIVAFLGAQFWGVPYYIQSEVKRQVDALHKGEQTPKEVTTLIAKMEGMESSVIRIDGSMVRVEGKIDHLTGLFVADLERRANR